MITAGRDASCVLPDGRTLNYWEGGDPEGRVMLYHPGTPASHVLGRFGHAAARSAGVRLVSVSRPGYGGSTPTSTRPSLLAAGKDTAALAVSIGAREYAVFGSSGGGPFAVATAVADPDSVRALGVLAGVGPWRLLDEPDDAMKETRGFLALLDAGDLEGALQGFVQSFRQQMAGMSGLDVDARVDAFFGDATSWLVDDAEYRAICADAIAVNLNGFDGYAYDHIAWGGTWDVDPRDVIVPTLLWCGQSDEECPASYGQWYADRINGSKLTLFPGEGHFDVCHGHWPEVLAGLLGVWS